jgi:hypothetical protein
MTSSAPRRELTEWEQAQEDAGVHLGVRGLGRGILFACIWRVAWRSLLRVVPPPYRDAAILTMTASWFWWGAVSFFVGLTLSAAWDEFEHTAPCMWLRSRKAQWLLGLVLLVGTLPGLLLRDWYVSFERETMAVSDFWTLGTEYRRPYRDVRQVTLAPTGRKHALSLDARYSSGLPWKSEYGAAQHARLDALKEAGSFVAARARVPFKDRSDALLKSIEKSRRTGVR